MKRLLYFIICYVAGFTFLFSQKVNIASHPAWVQPVKFDYDQPIEQDDISSSYSYFMHDMQVNVALRTYYYHYAYKIFNNKGVSNASQLYFNYNPVFQKLVIHSIGIRRGGTYINKLKSSKIDDIQREESLDDNIYDGSRTVSVIIDDVRSGDIIEYEYSLTGTNPIFKEKFYFSFYLNGYNSVRYISCKIIKPVNRKFNVKYLNKLYEPTIEKVNNTEIITWLMTNSPGLKSEENMPYWLDIYDLVEISEYDNWKDVIDWGKDVFGESYVASALLDKKIEEFKKIGNPEIQTIQALRFVQNDIRYFGIEMGVNSHKPKSPNDVLLSGYGDCKDKTFLLCYILNKLNIKSYPVLISTEKRLELTKLIPSPSQFNHVIAMVVLNDKNLFFDPTIPGQGGDLKNYYSPNYYYGLALKDSINYLIDIPVHRNSEVKLQEFYNVKSMKGESSLIVKTFYSGYEADETRYKFLNSNLKDIQETYFKFYESIYKNVSYVNNFTYRDNEGGNIITSTENYDIKNIWDENEENNGKLSLSFGAHFINEELKLIDVTTKSRVYPLLLPFPATRQHIIEVQLPEKWNINFDEKTIENKYISYKNRVTYIGNKLKLSYTLRIKEHMVASIDYESFKKDIEDIKKDLTYSLTWNEKVNSQTKNSNINWLVVMIALLISVLCVLLFIFLYNKMAQKEDNTFVPLRLGGWLVFPFIGLFLNAIAILISIFRGNYFNKTFWLLRSDESSSDYLPGFSSVIIFELCMNVFILFLSVFLIVIFIKNYKSVPKLMIFYYLLYFTFATLDHVFNALIIDKTELFYLSSGIIRTMVSCIIWIPYFVNSQRVKDTFVS